FQKLIYEPCISIPKEELHVKVIVIDGLDECIDKMMQTSILYLLAKAVCNDKFLLGFSLQVDPRFICRKLLMTRR
ncbi:hypothetical protein BDQ17DRAFT_1253179, partial [Cyathus striatus]